MDLEVGALGLLDAVDVDPERGLGAARQPHTPPRRVAALRDLDRRFLHGSRLTRGSPLLEAGVELELRTRFSKRRRTASYASSPCAGSSGVRVIPPLNATTVPSPITSTPASAPRSQPPVEISIRAATRSPGSKVRSIETSARPPSARISSARLRIARTASRSRRTSPARLGLPGGSSASTRSRARRHLRRSAAGTSARHGVNRPHAPSREQNRLASPGWTRRPRVCPAA